MKSLALLATLWLLATPSWPPHHELPATQDPFATLGRLMHPSLRVCLQDIVSQLPTTIVASCLQLPACWCLSLRLLAFPVIESLITRSLGLKTTASRLFFIHIFPSLPNAIYIIIPTEPYKQLFINLTNLATLITSVTYFIYWLVKKDLGKATVEIIC